MASVSTYILMIYLLILIPSMQFCYFFELNISLLKVS